MYLRGCLFVWIPPERTGGGSWMWPLALMFDGVVAAGAVLGTTTCDSNKVVNRHRRRGQQLISLPGSVGRKDPSLGVLDQPSGGFSVP